jgi:polyisoprenoid-binding protein YceI
MWAGPAALILMIGLIVPAGLVAQRPIGSGQLGQGTLSFDGDANVGDFIGTTTTITGEVTGSPDLSGVRGWVEAPVNTLKTGSGRRDRDLNKSMETDKYPTMRFDLTGVIPGAAHGDTTAVTLQGKLRIHGVSREVALPGLVIFEPGGVRLRSDFPVDVKDYQVGGLTKMLGILRMSEHIVVHVDVLFKQS